MISLAKFEVREGMARLVAKVGARKAPKGKSQAGRIPPTGNPPWRPLIPLYKPRYCQKVIDWGKKGWTETQMAVAIGVTRAAMRKWRFTHPEFGEALAYANDCAKAYWEEIASVNLGNKDFREKTWSKIMACRWRDEYSERVLMSDSDDDEDERKQVDVLEVIVGRLTRIRDRQDAGERAEDDARLIEPRTIDGTAMEVGVLGKNKATPAKR